MKNKNHIQMTFREVDGIWRRVDSQEPKPPTLADICEQLGITFDDNCEFARYKIYREWHENISIWVRAYGGKITIDIWNDGKET